MQPIAEVLSSKRIEDSTGLRLCVSLNERENSLMCTTQRDSLAQISKAQGDAARSAMSFWLFRESLSFVAVVQPTDLRHRQGSAGLDISAFFRIPGSSKMYVYLTPITEEALLFFQCRNISHIPAQFLGFQQPAHDLAAARLL